MISTAPPQAGIIRRLSPLVVSAAAVVVAMLCIVLLNRDASWLLVFICVVPTLFAALIALAVRNKGRICHQALTLVAISLAVAWLAATNYMATRIAIRWLVQSDKYKAEVMALREPKDGTPKHVEWDSWGFAGVANTVIYLVFDPTDSLLEASRSKAAGRVSGIPCSVAKNSRMEKQWYTVFFYTDTDWTNCGSAQ